MKKRVLILDDDVDILQICTIVLRKKGYDVQTLNSSNQVVSQAALYHPDVILMDNWIPGPGGIEATRLLKLDPETLDIPVIFFSANSNITELAREAQADYFLQKPFDIATLEAIVQMAVKKDVGSPKQQPDVQPSPPSPSTPHPAR
ncbi:response regulator [Puia dinghuensis]|uniref:Response regulator n=1 Tax=Puia dinghuensis TaxID=1792502 RepID=A0A8J2UC39_9BACT|nr:response regulator [Puia dinghuensis]GGA94134.1 response regulator [Puia dinghuensis]